MCVFNILCCTVFLIENVKKNLDLQCCDFGVSVSNEREMLQQKKSSPKERRKMYIQFNQTACLSFHSEEFCNMQYVLRNVVIASAIYER